MFVKTLETKAKKVAHVAAVTVWSLFALSALGVSTPVLAADNVAPDWKSLGGTIPVTVKLDNVTRVEGPIYVSIQTREHYQSMKGFGGIIKQADYGEMTATFSVDEPGEYAVSIWHDLDDDGRFSMTETYQILDGWGASGTPPEKSAPTFDDVKIKVESFGATVPVAMKYPD
jgi:uncharacterized protein (DUF2141 family)